MVEWARKAGRHVLQEIEDLEEENVSTLFNLSLFWHSQGSWKKAFLYKGYPLRAITSYLHLADSLLHQDSQVSCFM